MKTKVQAFGRFLSGMVMPNISAFIAWGFITALFIPTGWLALISGQSAAKDATQFIVYGFDLLAITKVIVGPMITYLLPLLIAYTGGTMVYKQRGGVIGAVTAMGVIASATIPMFLGAMIVGPTAAYILKKIDELILPRVKAGFEMLVNNYMAGILGLIFAMVSYYMFGPIITEFSKALGNVVEVLVKNNLMFLSSVFVEPAKVLFLNNAINHGVFSPIGAAEVQNTGKSLLFLIEANPGPGLGILLAFMFFGKGQSKRTAPGAAIIHFIGGIHEIYFPYVLMKPKMIFAAILGGMTGVAVLNVTSAGLVSPASPGSIIAVLSMTAAGDHWKIILSVVAATIVSFGVGAALLKFEKGNEEDEFEVAEQKMKEMKFEAKGIVKKSGPVKLIIVACDAGMGSSAMGATLLRNKLKEQGVAIEVKHTSIDQLRNETPDLIITQETLAARASENSPSTQIKTINNFLDASFYDSLVEELK